MSPFSQLGSSINSFSGHGGGIDRNFSPILNYLDEFDRHFSHRHRFMNCFIPRFDLEEDSANFYLYGEVPGAKVEDISIEAHDDHTLVISGTTHRPGPPQGSMQSPGHEFVKVDAPAYHNGEYIENDGAFAGKAAAEHHHQEADNSEFNPPSRRPAADVNASNAIDSAPDNKFLPPPQAPHPTTPLPGNQLNPEVTNSGTSAPEHLNDGELYTNSRPQRRVLLSERLTGEFHRTFAFPSLIEEAGTKATVENGVLYLVVPKREAKKKLGKRIPILGSWSG